MRQEQLLPERTMEAEVSQRADYCWYAAANEALRSERPWFDFFVRATEDGLGDQRHARIQFWRKTD